VRRWVGIGAALAVLLTAAVLARDPALPGAVATTTPADGAVLATAPTEVDLEFTAPVDDFQVSVRDATGTSVTVGRAGRFTPYRLRQAVTIAGPGEMTVDYRVTFVEGGTLRGSVRFGVGVGVTGGGDAPAADASHEHGVDPLGAVLLILDGAVAVGAVLLLMLRPPRRRSPGRPTH
jgi:methionine-rich copper-binding protein CopC